MIGDLPPLPKKPDDLTDARLVIESGRAENSAGSGQGLLPAQVLELTSDYTRGQFRS